LAPAVATSGPFNQSFIINLLKIPTDHSKNKHYQMKQISAGVFVSLLSLIAFGQQEKPAHTLLWKITGKGIEKPSYLYGTIHMICEDAAGLSDNMKKAIKDCDEVYFEVDLDNIFEMLGVIDQLKMKGDTTLQDLLSEADYQKVKEYFESRESMLPFSMLETFKPMLAASTLEETSFSCETAMLEQVIMQEARQYDKKVKGLETMAYQAGVLDSIPYKLQAEQLVAYISNTTTGEKDGQELEKMMNAYKEQNLDKLEKLLISTDAGISGFTDILLYHRNQNWVKKLKELLPDRSLMIAVGAGHLPGEKGVINLLRKAGFTLTPVENKINKTKII
jgi:uncharacterized protein YbaP (TraB family)